MHMLAMASYQIQYNLSDCTFYNTIFDRELILIGYIEDFILFKTAISM